MRKEKKKGLGGREEGAQEGLLYYEQKNRFQKDGSGLRQALKAFEQALQGIKFSTLL